MEIVSTCDGWSMCNTSLDLNFTGVCGRYSGGFLLDLNFGVNCQDKWRERVETREDMQDLGRHEYGVEMKGKRNTLSFSV